LILKQRRSCGEAATKGKRRFNRKKRKQRREEETHHEGTKDTKEEKIFSKSE